jgi:hypothetical protein
LRKVGDRKLFTTKAQRDLQKTKASREGGPIVFELEAAFLCADVAPAAFRLSAAAAVGATATATATISTTTAAAVAATTSTTVAATAAAAVTTTSAATTATTAAASAERTATAATSARRTILGRIHAEGAAAQIVSIELFDRFRRIFIRFEFDEREPAGSSRLAIGRKKHVSYRSDLRKQRFDLVARCVEVEIPYENLGSHQHLLFCG